MTIVWFIIGVAITISFIVAGAPMWLIIANVVLDAVLALTLMVNK